MSERTLRDEIELLSSRVKAARAKVAHQESLAAAEVVGPLRAQVDEARARRDELARQVRLARARLDDREQTRETLRADLEDARAGIARLEPPEDPLGRDAPSWAPNQQQGGCLQVLVLSAVGLALGLATGWLT